MPYRRYRTNTGTKDHAAWSDDEQLTRHGYGGRDRVLCGIVAHGTHHVFRPARRNACATCAAAVERGDRHAIDQTTKRMKDMKG